MSRRDGVAAAVAAAAAAAAGRGATVDVRGGGLVVIFELKYKKNGFKR